MDNLESKINGKTATKLERIKTYFQGCIDPANAKLYGTFQERASLNITQFPKIQGSLLIRMGLVYPLMSYLVEKAGIPADMQTEIYGIAINYHTWAAGYLAYVTEIQLGMSKYPMELISKGMTKVKDYFSSRTHDRNPA